MHSHSFAGESLKLLLAGSAVGDGSRNVYQCYDVAVLRDPRMTEVVVTRKGQTTIPAELRAKYRIQEGSRLEVIDAGNGIMFRPKKSFLDLAGSGAEKATVTEMKRLLDKLREESIQNC